MARTKKQSREPPVFIPPTLEECEQYAVEKGQKKEYGQKFYFFYSPEWVITGNGAPRPISNWKNKLNQWIANDNLKVTQNSKAVTSEKRCGDYSWYLKEIDKSKKNSELIECVKDEHGKPLWRYK